MVAALPFRLLSVLLAQGNAPAGRARGRPDAGDSAERRRGDKPILLGTDPPGRLRNVPAGPDAGVAARDAGPDEVHRELQALRARLEQLEQERSRSQQTAQQLQQLNEQVQL